MRKKLCELNLLDDFLFGTVVRHPVWGESFSRLLLETIFQKKFRDFQVIPQKVYYGKDTSLHGTRLDVYLEAALEDELSGQTAVYDMEPNRKKEPLRELSRRNRLYHALIDADCLKSGENYISLKNVFVIFILSNDPFGAGRMVYTVRTMCVEEPDLPYYDGAQTMFLYTGGTKGSPPKALVQMLRYMEHSIEKYAVNETLKQIHHIVEMVKQNKEVELSYMKSWEWEEEIRKEAMESGLAEGREKGLKEGLKEGLREGLREGREKERRNTEREARRADQAEAELKKLKEELRKYQLQNRV